MSKPYAVLVPLFQRFTQIFTKSSPHVLQDFSVITEGMVYRDDTGAPGVMGVEWGRASEQQK